jgi:NAD(P)-dependent dehydrogenase (short-subunit alcohol dehydrogenase family)
MLPPRPTKAVLITGGAKGVGLIMARALQAAGWDVSACGRSPHTPHPFAYNAIDLAVPGAGHSLIGRFETLPDALVCSAGNYGPLGSLTAISQREWRDSFNLNFFAVVEIVQAYLLRVKAAPTKPRKIVILGGGGLGGSHVPERMSAYQAAKAALTRFAEVLAVEAQDAHVDINVLLPGAFETGITEQARAAGISVTVNGQTDEATRRAKLEKVIVRLLSADLEGVTGRLISAQWDAKWLESPAALIRDTNLLTLRRIDNDLFW